MSRLNTARASIVQAALASVRLKCCVPKRRPPKRMDAPSTNSVLPRMLPASVAFTVVVSPALRAATVMISSAALPKVALRRPPSLGPVCTATSSVASPRKPASGIRESALTTKISGGRACETASAMLTGTSSVRPRKIFVSVVSTGIRRGPVVCSAVSVSVTSTLPYTAQFARAMMLDGSGKRKDMNHVHCALYTARRTLRAAHGGTDPGYTRRMVKREWHYHHRSFAGGAGYRICLRLYRAVLHERAPLPTAIRTDAASWGHANSERELNAAARAARAMGLPTLVLHSGFAGGTAEAARGFAHAATQVRRRGRPLHPPCCLLAGDETHATVPGDADEDSSERNAAFALTAAFVLDGAEEIVVASLPIGGGGGGGEYTNTAGAVATTHTLAHARTLGLDAADYLRRNDARAFFAHVGGLMQPRATDTGTHASALMIALIA